MRLLGDLFRNNQEWAQRTESHTPGFFERLAEQQAPQYFWIGCADSRVPANEIVGLMPGEIFVHRNVANVVNPFDPNCGACLHYAVDVLRVKHVMVVGHYGCGGIRAVLDGEYRGKVGEWLAPVRAIHQKYAAYLDGDHQAQWKTLSELNVVEQTAAVWKSPVVQEAWSAGRELAVHGWIYSVRDGLLRDLNVTVTSSVNADDVRKQALDEILGVRARQV
ncbi:MAG TPA: carbonic anhydrase [Bryobacteraceae bacterium]|jgi:carbonic anhydrase|nr:carbonic anhydrase [Bryobacteraceae bacterium]